MGKAIDYTGQRFGKLTVIGIDPDYVPKTGRHKKWLCQCDCGNIKIVQSNHLKDGTAIACSFACKNRIEIGSHFGKLTVIEMTNIRDKNSGSVLYKCICECGNEILVSSTELRAGRRNSCLECHESKGCLMIKELLKNNNIDFIQEYIFKDCINPKTKRGLRFDFYLPNTNCLIEFDGEQHFIPVEFWGGKQGLQEIQNRDIIKNNYCKQHNIPLIRIPYTVNNITLEDINVYTSKYLI